MWIAEKFQSNPEIAGSPRNSFRASLVRESHGGRALNVRGGREAYQRLSNHECHRDVPQESDCMRQVGQSKGKKPRPSAKVPKIVLSGEGCRTSRTARMLAQKQPFIQRVRNSSLAERSRAENARG